MPNFLWVLRDFVLELEDEKGRSITAKEYLEQALQERYYHKLLVLNYLGLDMEEKMMSVKR